MPILEEPKVLSGGEFRGEDLCKANGWQVGDVLVNPQLGRMVIGKFSNGRVYRQDACGKSDYSNFCMAGWKRELPDSPTSTETQPTKPNFIRDACELLERIYGSRTITLATASRIHEALQAAENIYLR